VSINDKRKARPKAAEPTPKASGSFGKLAGQHGRLDSRSGTGSGTRLKKRIYIEAILRYLTNQLNFKEYDD
jgi:hypothetical protein